MTGSNQSIAVHIFDQECHAELILNNNVSYRQVHDINTHLHHEFHL